MLYNLNIENPYVIENDDFCMYSTISLKKLADSSFKDLNANKKRILNFFGLDSFRKVTAIFFDNHNEFRNYVLSLREPGAHLPEYATGVFDKGRIISYVNPEEIKDKNKFVMKVSISVHEFVHIVNREKVYKERVVWLDEGLATNLDNKKDELKDNDKFIEFMNKKILNIEKFPVMNDLTHQGKGFKSEFYNGYDLVYFCARYLIETTDREKLLKILKDYDLSIKIGKTVLQDAIKYYKNKFYL